METTRPQEARRCFPKINCRLLLPVSWTHPGLASMRSVIHPFIVGWRVSDNRRLRVARFVMFFFFIIYLYFLLSFGRWLCLGKHFTWQQMAAGSSKHQVGGPLLTGDDGNVLPTHSKDPISRPLWDIFTFSPDSAGRSPTQFSNWKELHSCRKTREFALCLQLCVLQIREIIRRREKEEKSSQQ